MTFSSLCFVFNKDVDIQKLRKLRNKINCVCVWLFISEINSSSQSQLCVCVCLWACVFHNAMCVSYREQENLGGLGGALSSLAGMREQFPFQGRRRRPVRTRARLRTHARTHTTTTTFIQEAPSAHTGNSWGQELLPGAGNFPSAEPNTLTLTHSVQTHTFRTPKSHKHTVKQVA